MSIKSILLNLTIEELAAAADKYTSASHYLRDNNFPEKGDYTKILNSKLAKYDFEWSLASYRIPKKKCPACNKTFQPKDRKTVTCGYSCSNTYFRSGENNGAFKAASSNYRTRCFMVHEKKCIICGEDKIVSVHHYDEDNTNNAIENLIPLCPTHHQYVHSRYKELVQPAIDEWRNNFMQA